MFICQQTSTCFIYKTKIKIIMIMIKEIVIVIIFRVCIALLEENDSNVRLFFSKRAVKFDTLWLAKVD